MDEVNAVRLQILETGFQAGHCLVGIALLNFGDQENLFAARGHHFANAGFADAIAISLRCIHVVNAAIDRFVERFERLSSSL